MTVAVDFVAALVGLRPPAAATKSTRPAFSKPRQKSTQNPRGPVQTTGASSLDTSVDDLVEAIGGSGVSKSQVSRLCDRSSRDAA
jgi:putative transposase